MYVICRIGNFYSKLINTHWLGYLFLKMIMVNFTFSIRKVLLGHDDHHSRYCRSLVHTVGSYLNYTTAIQANNNQFGAGVYIGHVFTLGNHAVIGIRVDNNLCIDK